MFKVTLTYLLKKPADNDAIQKVWSVVAGYSRKGQLVGEVLVTLGPVSRSLCVTGMVHERSSLSRKYESRETRNALAELSPFLRKRPTLDRERLAEDGGTCTCTRSTALVFAPEVILGASPLRCLDCWDRRPLYRLRSRSADEDLRELARQWISFYWMFMDSGSTEALAWRQLADPESIFSRMTRKRLKGFEKKLGIPVYFELYTHYISRSPDPPEVRICPGCGRRWSRLDEKWRTCARCRLVSHLPNERDLPDWWRPLPRHRSAKRPTKSGRGPRP
jgi:predicted  nucleic acid-binding Zn ribbon protein